MSELADGTPVSADLFVTCIIDQLFPEVGVSAVRVLRRHGARVGFPEGQTCCGQAVYNSGYRREARELALKTMGEFEESEYVVVPSGSCAAMMRVFYLDLFEDEPELLPQVRSFSRKVYEFSEFLVQVLGVEGVDSRFRGNDGGSGNDGALRQAQGEEEGTRSEADGARGEGEPSAGPARSAVFHPGCHLLREMEVRAAPESLLGSVNGLEMREMRNAETCCGFGGTFSVKLPHISEGMLADKVASVRESGADTLVSCDMSCLMHIGGALRREAPGVEIRHIAQVLDGGLSEL